MKFYKKMGAILVAFTLVILQSVGFVQHASAATIDNAAIISVQDQNGDVVIPMKVMKLQKDEKAFDVLKDLTSQLDFKMDPKLGASIKGIGGVKPKSPAYWGFIVNGQAASVGVSSYQVQPGDDLLFKVVNYPPKTVNVSVKLTDKSGNAIVDQNGDPMINKKDASVSVVKGTNAYDALKQALGSKLNASIDDQYFAFIKGIDNVTLKKGSFWGFSINGVLAKVGVTDYVVKDGDQLTLVGDPSQVSTDSGKGNSNAPNAPNTREFQISKAEVEKSIQDSVQFIQTHGVTGAYGAIGLLQAGEKVPQEYLDSEAKKIKDNNGEFHNVTDYEKMTLGITAGGINATNFAAYNLIEKIDNNSRMKSQGNNGPVYALLAFDSGNYKVSDAAKWSRDKLVDLILKNQLSSGAFTLQGDTASVDMTGTTLAALAPYKKEEKVQKAINKAVQWLSKQQNKSGGYGSEVNGGDSSESTSQVIIGLTAVGVNPTEARFTKTNGNLISHLLTFKQSDGGFAHIQSDKKSNAISTPQALMALTAYDHYLNNKGSVFQFNASQLNSTVVKPLLNKASIVINIFMACVGIFVIVFALLFWIRKRKTRQR